MFENNRIRNCLLQSIVAALFFVSSPARAEQPNVVLMGQDNFGWGEVGAYGRGALRGAPTARIDSIAEEDMKLGSGGQSMYARPSMGIGGDKSTEWGIEFGYKIAWNQKT